MAATLNPYVSFDGNAREAMEFYREVFGGELTISTFGDMGAPEGEGADGVMHANLATEAGLTLMGADMPPGETHTRGNSMTVSLSGDDGGELRGYWDKLSEGGAVMVSLEKQVWGDEFGMCVDRFGTPWMVNIVAPQNQG